MSNITLSNRTKRNQGILLGTAHFGISEQLINDLLIQLNPKARVSILQKTRNRRANADIVVVTDCCRDTIGVVMAAGNDNQTDWYQDGGADE